MSLLQHHTSDDAPRPPDDEWNEIQAALYCAPIERLVENRLDLRLAIDAATDEAELDVIAVWIDLNQAAIEIYLQNVEPAGHA